jgi:chemosensory pili system protein ChpA (sensor histidine kinase/response regulator)
MSDNHSFLALDWVKGEIEETLKQARQALEAFVENPEDNAQMRFCLAYLHQVYGTLQVVEFYGAALLAEEMEKTCLALINGQVARVADGQEVLMRAILQLPPYLDRVKSSRRDLPVVVLPLLNDLRAVRGEPLLSETALFTPDLAAGERAPIQVGGAAIDLSLLKKIRQAYQLALLGIIRNDNVADNLKKMAQVFARLESLAGATQIRELWQVSAAIIEGLQEQTIEAGTSVKMLLGQIDRQLRLAADDSNLRAPTELMKNLLYYVARSTGSTPRLRSVKDLYKLDEALPGEALVNEERARMHGPDREAMKSVVDALCEELARVKDALDLFVRKSTGERNLADLGAMVPVLKQVADTVAVLGLGQPRRILQEQIETIDRITVAGQMPEDGMLLDIAGALLYVEATLLGMVAEKPMGQQRNAASEFSASDQLSDAQSAVLRESRSALEKAKDAVIEYIASQWNPTHLTAIPELIDSVRGSLAILQLERPAQVLAGATRYIAERLVAGQHRPDWQEMDTLADVITSVEYYLERIANDAQGGDHILDIAERSLSKLFTGEGAAAAASAAVAPEAESAPDAGEWQQADEDAFEAEIAEAIAPPVEALPVETLESEVLLRGDDDTQMRPVPDELKEMQERLHVGNFGDEVAIDDAAGDISFGDLADETLSDAQPRQELPSLPATGASAGLPAEEQTLALHNGDGDFGLDDFTLEDVDTLSADAPSDWTPEAAAPEPTADEISLDDTMAFEPAAAAEAAAPEPVVTVADDLAGLSLEDDFSTLGDDAFPALEMDAVVATPAAVIADAVPEPVPEPEPAPVAAAPAAEPPKKPILPVLTSMPVDDHDFDEEIREIFVEEAEEVMENINEYFPKWAGNFDDTASLLEFRRGFHTLKGSGRMVGAKVMGELAWAFENMLNKVRDKVLPPDQVMVNAISECLALVPGLVEDFAQRNTPRYDTSPLMAAAEAISRGEKLTAMDVARAADQAHGNAEAEGEPSSDEFDALAASLEPASDTLPAADAAVDEMTLESLASEDDLAFFDTPAEAPAADADDGVFDLSAEAGDLSLDAPAGGDDLSFFENAATDAPALDEPASDAAAAFPEMAALDAELSAADEFTLPGDDSPAMAVTDTPPADMAVDDLALGDLALEEAALAEAALDDAVPAPEAAAAPDETVAEAPVAAEPEPQPEIDPMLLEIFSGEADMHLESLVAYLDGVDPDRSTATITDEVLRSLHTLKGSAGMAGIKPVADVAAPLEHLFKDLRNQVGHARHEHLQALREGVAFIRDTIIDLNNAGAGELPGRDVLIAHIRQLDQDRLADLERQQEARLNPDSHALTAATQGLVASFMQLGIDHVLDAPWELEGWLNGADATVHIDTLQQELARLRDAAQDKQVDPLAQLCDRMVEVYRRLGTLELTPEGELLNDLASAHDEIVNVFDTLAASQTVQPNEALLTHLQDLLDNQAAAPAPVISDEPAVAAFEPEVQQSLAELVTEGDDTAWQDAGAMTSVESVDPELLEIFLEEADEVLEAAESELDNWRRDNENTPALAALQRHLHTLKGGARLAEIRPLGDLAHELEFLYEGLVDGRYPSTPDLVDLLQRCHDRLADMVSELRNNGRCPAGIDLVNAINAYRRDPAAGVNLGAAAPAAPVADEPAEPWNQDFAMEPDDSLAAVEAIELPAEDTLPAEDDLSLEMAAASPDAAPAVAKADAESAGDSDAIFAEFFPAAAAAAAAAPEAAVVPPAPAVVAAAPEPAASNFDPELLEIFLEEAGEIVDATSEQLATWKSDPNNTLPVQELQRGLHTLKGGARMAEISALGDLAHQLEFLYEGVCGGLMTPTDHLFSLLQRCHDRLADAVEALRRAHACPETADLVHQINAYIADPEHFQDTPATVTLKPVAAEAPAPAAPVEMPAPRAIEAAPVPENVDNDILEIFLEESEELAEGIETALNEWLDNHDATAPLEALMRHLHTLKGGARLAGLKQLGDIAHDWETELVAIQSGSRKADNDFFASLNDRLESVLAGIKAVSSRAAAAAAAAVPEQPATPAPVAAAPAPVAANAPVPAAAPKTRVASAGAKPPSMLGGFIKDTSARGPQEMIRVPSDLLEKLVNLAGETSITRSRVEMGVHGFAQTVEEMGATIQRLADQLRRMDSEMETQIVARHNDEAGKYEDFDPLEMDQYSSLNQLSKALAESASDLLDLKSTLIDKAKDTETLLLQQARINTELQEGLMRSRMVPFSRLVPRLKRIVRQTGQEVGKPADLDVINSDGEMDRTLLERIVAPLEHMLRNSVDHGLEDPAGRAAAGKPAQGRVTLTLAREGGEVVLTLADDGRGINIAAVRAKALERGLITEGQDISDQDVIQFIFHAGFSTAAKVTQVSGRGVGMDVVQSEIKQMGGVVSIHSVTGQGTTFTIRLPFTVAVNRALMVRVGEDIYAIPLAQIEGIVRASPYELETYYGPDAPLFEYASVTYRLNYLGEFVHGVKSPNLVGQTMPLPVLLIRGSEQRVAIQVDQLIGSREIVVKAVGAQLATVAGLSGATILGDGSVVIILDVTAMLRAASLVTPRISIGGVDALPTPVESKRTRQVMVVDDSVTVRKVTSRLLERHGYEVLLAKDGMDAIAKLEDARPDIMLLDIEMPRMDGFEVATLVRHNPHLEDLPIIMITSRTGEKHRERAFQIGVNCYMGKPFQEEQLLETISELLAAATVK